MKKLLVVILFIFGILVVQAQATTVKVTWLPNSEVDLAGYRFYLLNIINPLDVYMIGQVGCSVQNNISSYTLNFNIPGGARYLLVMTAFDKVENESARSRPARDSKNKRVVFFNKNAPKSPEIQSLNIIKEN